MDLIRINYRHRLMENGRFVTLREKDKARPQLSKLIGAIDLHMKGGDEDQIETVKFLESKGVKRILINSDASGETLDWMRRRGYLAGSYRIYTDIYPPRPGLKEEVTRGYTQDAYALEDGSPVRGFAYNDAKKSTYRCSLLQLPLMKELIPALRHDRRYEAIFLDVVTSGIARDCYSPAHPLDRLEDRKAKIELLRYTTGLGLVTGSEDGADWAAPYLDYFEGMVMTRHFGYVAGVTVNTWPRKFDLDDEYININLNERVRAPLWDLVFHDSVVSTWRWNFTPDRYSDPKWWNKHDLMQMIGGDVPIFMVNRKHLDANGDRIAQTYKDVSEWNARIGWDELVDHRALTPDRSVQESRFSSGWAIAVNFSSDRPYKGKEGTIQPWSYKIYR
jgi:Glycosyl hydrolases related to GH101 family, GH129